MKNPYSTMQLLCAAIIFTLSESVFASNFTPIIKEQPHNIYHTVKNKTLMVATNQLANRTGITFKISPGLENDLIDQKIAADNWESALAQLLHGYNYTTASENGAIKSVVITGYNGSGKDQTSTLTEMGLVTITPETTAKLPDKYKNYKPGSVFKLDLPIQELANLPVGKGVLLDLPIGQYKVQHDNMVDDGDGASTWIGYLDDEGKGYRVYLSQGATGIMGNIYTPDGSYTIETVDGTTVLVDLEKSGLQNVGFDTDSAEPAINTFMDVGIKAQAKMGKAGYSKKSKMNIGGGSGSGVAYPSGTVVDLMVLYTINKQSAAYAKQRIKYLVTVSNQAYADSGINMSLRLVHTHPTKYVENNANAQALADLASSQGAFKGTSALRNKFGADLVMLFRPLYAQTAGSCGSTYVGFASGGEGIPDYGYGTIGDGTSKDGMTGYYCAQNTFTHEIGHALGNVHDRENSSFSGKFPYSYAWGINNMFGTIMSSYGPSVMLFSNPNLSTNCAGTPCGYPVNAANSSDQATTINYTAPIVSNYRPTKTGNPVIN